ncbi:tRNA glutamyl-Q(34) synthetase GluQRS [Nesterenkonia alkaliphila]|uniref:Glutamyl-Q tRNA(Asp) synthetase n=1 Tax=Nesterenkonia alkaliphila TaxID=1463631 RepID=A0A7K1UJQ8_9MICC|nr:tRNA glutamyl-Q(34) synthetase GluQRS [Nesterenkonia alkaliphila]MVT26719.1 tRNA glutamyl-Q(34) synthetase GluQRS [Nesterenkonia alkaliphila]GFZ76960.1 glutamyl-Q tRNA(Asp) synthetase [Nesterenkonia alkaliphila]
MPAGRYAPSPSGDLHLGNLRTAILAWLFARASGRALLLRYEDLDTGRTVPGSAERQAADMRALGITFDGEATHQSQRRDYYDDALDQLRAQGLVYECFCTRREIQEAPRAPHAPPGAYPGTCRNLTDQERRRRRRQRTPALRLRAEQQTYTVYDQLLGQVTAAVDDVVLLRNDGAAAYNLAVVVDDQLSGVDQVVRADDLADSAPRQAYLRGLLYGQEAAQAVEYAHVPLVVNDEGKRLAKRDGAVTLAQLGEQGVSAEQVRDLLLASLGLPPGPLEQALAAFRPEHLPREPWVWPGGPQPGAEG